MFGSNNKLYFIKKDSLSKIRLYSTKLKVKILYLYFAENGLNTYLNIWLTYGHYLV